MTDTAKGAIRNPDAYVEAALRRRTERFDICFPRGISFGDIDSFVEINNQFLILEWKKNNQPMPVGQAIGFQALARIPSVSLWVLWTDEEGKITHATSSPARPRKPVTEELVATEIKKWVSKAESNDNATEKK